MTLGASQCYGFITAPTLGGQYETSNIERLDIAVYLSLMGQIHEQIEDLPDGAKISIVTGN